MNPVALSFAGVGLALLVLWANLRPWWKGGRDPKALLPYGSTLLLGLLATMCAGGLLGWGAAGIVGIFSGGGDTVVSAAAGTSGTTMATARLGTLTAPGGIVVTFYAGAMVLLWKSAGKQDKRRMLGGLATGAVLGILPGVVLLLDWLPDTVNSAGATAQAFFEGKVRL
ncbi:hypothetical protein PUR59_04230 [Streptomyces sp. SP18ES09]|uniref:hypothetical protein n=1 Tax=Streptomyces sp. SP18ES09 TaxID=3002532 RepID=UPI002E764DF4|nr:hypothetical protein [Streptomyces sp. SP18ES09]MEE1814228.1 hypothetical protein [Streptomyces sp. SP18ES09]